MLSFRPKDGRKTANRKPTVIEISQSVYMMSGLSFRPTVSAVLAEAVPFVSAVSAM